MASRSDLTTVFGVDEPSALEVEEKVQLPSFNVAPTQGVAIVVDHRDRDTGTVTRAAAAARWGLVPSWSREIKGPPLINARVESADRKPSFRKAFTARRCVFPARGYYEWAVGGDGRKQAFYLHPVIGDVDQVLAFAGLYEWWPKPEAAEDDPDRWLLSATILTTDAHGPAGEVHDRTPVALPHDRVAAWLDPSLTTAGDVKQLLEALPPAELTVDAVSNRVGNVKNNAPDLVDPLPEVAPQPLELTYV